MESKGLQCRTHLEPKSWGAQDLGFFCSSWAAFTEPTTNSSVHQSTQWDVLYPHITGHFQVLGSSHSIPVVPKSFCITAVIQNGCVGGACLVSVPKKKGLYFDVMTVSMQSVITSLSSGLSCVDASVYHTVRPLAALLVSQPSRPRLHIPTQSSRFTVSDCKEFLCSGSARSLSAEKSFLCHYQWLHPPAEESSYHAPYH